MLWNGFDVFNYTPSNPITFLSHSLDLCHITFTDISISWTFFCSLRVWEAGAFVVKQTSRGRWKPRCVCRLLNTSAWGRTQHLASEVTASPTQSAVDTTCSESSRLVRSCWFSLSLWLCSSRCPQAEHQRQRHVDHHRRRWGHDSYPGALRRRQQPLQALLHHPRPDRHLPLRSSRARLRQGRGLHHQLHGWEFNVVLWADLSSSFGHTWLDFSWYAICQQTLFSTWLHWTWSLSCSSNNFSCRRTVFFCVHKTKPHHIGLRNVHFGPISILQLKLFTQKWSRRLDFTSWYCFHLSVRVTSKQIVATFLAVWSVLPGVCLWTDLCQHNSIRWN